MISPLPGGSLLKSEPPRHGRYLRARRFSWHRTSQRELAEAAGAIQCDISPIESGNGHNVQFMGILRLAQGLWLTEFQRCYGKQSTNRRQESTVRLGRASCGVMARDWRMLRGWCQSRYPTRVSGLGCRFLLIRATQFEKKPQHSSRHLPRVPPTPVVECGAHIRELGNDSYRFEEANMEYTVDARRKKLTRQFPGENIWELIEQGRIGDVADWVRRGDRKPELGLSRPRNGCWTPTGRIFGEPFTESAISAGTRSCCSQSNSDTCLTNTAM